jgi:glutamyl-tRNA synthetase
VFRIEDTDASRATEDSMRSMMEAMHWIGLAWDEGPDVTPDGSLPSRGAYGPYRQSERTALYAAVARASKPSARPTVTTAPRRARGVA